MLERLKNLPPGSIVMTAGLIALVFFVVWVALILAVWNLVGPGGFDGSLWGALEGVSSAATLATVVGGGMIALAQLVEAIDNRHRELQARNLSSYNYIFELLMKDENIEARRWIYLNLTEDLSLEEGLALIASEGREQVKLVLNSFDYLGFLVEQDWVTDEAVIEWVSPFVVKTWICLGRFVEYEAHRRSEPDYYKAARNLAHQCQIWRNQKLGAEPRWFKDAI